MSVQRLVYLYFQECLFLVLHRHIQTHEQNIQIHVGREREADKMIVYVLGRHQTQTITHYPYTYISSFDWQTLEQRLSVTRLCLFYKVVYGLVVVVLLLNIQPVVRHSRCIRMNFRQLHIGKDSFFPLAIIQCIWCCLSWS